MRRRGHANDAAELLAALPAVQQRASKAFPHSEDAIAAFLPNLNLARAYAPDIFNGFGQVGQVTGYYDGNGHYARASARPTSISSTTTAAAACWNSSRRANSTTCSAPKGARKTLPRRRHPTRARRLQPLRRTARGAAQA